MERRDGAVDWPLIALALALSAFGIAMVYSAGQLERTAYFEDHWTRQLMWLTLGIGVAAVISRTTPRLLEWIAVPVYVLAIVLLVVLLVKGFGSGGGTAAGTRSWLTLGGIRIGQPAELAKIAVVLILARTLAGARVAPRGLFELWKPIALVGLPWALIMAQPDLGTGMVLVGIFYAMLFWSGASWTLLLLAASPAISLILAFSTGLWGLWFLALIAIVVWYKPSIVESVVLVGANVAMGVIAPMLWNSIQPYQRSRLLAFLSLETDSRSAGWHLMQSQVAIGSGGWFGKGFGAGTQKRLSFLPEQHTDFIFPVIAEELGFVGVAVVLTLLCALLLRTVRIATRAMNPFAGLAAFGLAAAWSVHTVVNVGMTLGVMPITGIPLPFFSYGGSFMLTCWVSIGVLVCVSASGRGRAEALTL